MLSFRDKRGANILIDFLQRQYAVAIVISG